MNGMPSFANPANLERRVEADAIEVATDATPLDFLQAVYRSATQPMQRRLKAAVEAAQFVHPKLSVTAALGGDFADRLEKAFGRSAKVIEREPMRPKTMVPDRRFRRA